MCLPLLLLIAGQASFASSRQQNDRSTAWMKRIVDELRKQMEIPDEVLVQVVPRNPRVVSVERVAGQQNTFELLFEESFLASLDDEEVRAVLAHELGHVWIFTHHPYLQTESLANQIGLRVVSRDSLDKVYDKLRLHQGITGNAKNTPEPERPRD